MPQLMGRAGLSAHGLGKNLEAETSSPVVAPIARLDLNYRESDRDRVSEGRNSRRDNGTEVSRFTVEISRFLPLVA